MICERVRQQFSRFPNGGDNMLPMRLAILQATDSRTVLNQRNSLQQHCSFGTKVVRHRATCGSGLSMQKCFNPPKHMLWSLKHCWNVTILVGTMTLLVYWLSQANRVGLQSGAISFSELCQIMLEKLDAKPLQTNDTQKSPDQVRWHHIQRFFDYVEANGEEFLAHPNSCLANLGATESVIQTDQKSEKIWSLETKRTVRKSNRFSAQPMKMSFTRIARMMASMPQSSKKNQAPKTNWSPNRNA